MAAGFGPLSLQHLFAEQLAGLGPLSRIRRELPRPYNALLMFDGQPIVAQGHGRGVHQVPVLEETCPTEMTMMILVTYC